MTKHASLADKAFGYHHPVRYLASALDDKVIRDYIHADFDRVFLARNYRAVTQTGNTLYLAIRTDIDIDNMHRVEDFDIFADDAERRGDARRIPLNHRVEGFCQCGFVSVKC